MGMLSSNLGLQPPALSSIPLQMLSRMEDINNLNLVSPDAIDDSVWLLDQFANIFAARMRNDAARKKKGGKLVSSLEDSINNSMSIRFRVSRDMRVDRSKRPERPVRPDHFH